MDSLTFLYIDSLAKQEVSVFLLTVDCVFLALRAVLSFICSMCRKEAALISQTFLIDHTLSNLVRDEGVVFEQVLQVTYIMNIYIRVLCVQLTWRLFQVWSQRAESANKLPSEAVSFTFRDIDIFPSLSQVHEMLQSANECSKRQNVDYITFGEFCVFASELTKDYEHKVPRPIPLSKPRGECRRLSNRRKSTMSNKCGGSKYEVFLGGSCNPTTWRTKIAIPALKESGVSYYNPQVSQWGPELMELENQAKQNAEVMFFVIDNQTRSVASMIEAAHIAGTQRKLILVVHEFEKPGSIVMGEKITEKEFMDLQQGQRYLQDIVERQGIPVFDKILNALNCAVVVLRKNTRPQDLTIQDAANPVKMPHLHIGEKLIKLREVFDQVDSTSSGKISLSDVCMAFKIITCTQLPIDNLKEVVAKQKGLLFDNSQIENINVDDLLVDFDQFCCIMTEFRQQTKNEPHQLDSLKTKASHLLCSVLNPLTRLVGWVRSENGNCVQNENDSNFSFSAECRDIYLGGSPKPSTWREDIAIPLLKKKGLTYFIPQDGAWSERLIPLEVKNMENSQVILFVITKDSRSLAQMVVAAHYVGLGCSVVLCIQFIEDETEINGEKLSSQAVKDYNRGRVYLSDLATRAGVPVFEKTEEAVECAMNLCLQKS